MENSELKRIEENDELLQLLYNVHMIAPLDRYFTEIYDLQRKSCNLLE
ncbi:hypothetical protein [Paenibacillus sp. FSL K6-2524]